MAGGAAETGYASAGSGVSEQPYRVINPDRGTISASGPRPGH